MAGEQPTSAPSTEPPTARRVEATRRIEGAVVRWDLESPSLAPPSPRLCVARRAERLWGLPEGNVEGLRTLGEPTPLPRTPATLVGVQALDGEILPVVDVAPLLGPSHSQAHGAVRPVPARVPDAPSVGSSRPALLVTAGSLRALFVIDALLAFEPYELREPAGDDTSASMASLAALGTFAKGWARLDAASLGSPGASGTAKTEAETALDVPVLDLESWLLKLRGELARLGTGRARGENP
ncbi:MAG: chemotaxis protein CheW [Holophagales bacterium]|nr:chemotaxis protein CheW [Holophagales bacterium]